MDLQRLVIFLTALALSLFFTGCLSTRPPEKAELDALKLWEPHLLFLNRTPHDSLYVEVDAVEGAEPSDVALKAFEEFLREHCDKPAGITVVRDDVIPRTAAVGYSHDALALQYLNGPPKTNENPAFIYVLYFDSNLTLDPDALPPKFVHKHLSLKTSSRYVKPQNPHVHLLPYPAAIYVDRRYLKTCPRSFEPLALCHEAAHVLGLTRNESHGAELHCRSERCLMNPALKVSLPKLLLGRSPFTQTNLCDQCQADLRNGTNAGPAANLRFLGPMLVRSEPDYHVLSLPSEIKLFSGDLSNFDRSKFIDQARSDGKRVTGRFTQRVWADFGEQESELEQRLNRLGEARTDCDWLVRHATTQLVMRAQAVLARAWLTNASHPPEQALKWLQDAAESGDSDAQKFLGRCYLNGTGVKQDELEAYKWFALAAKHGSKSATEERDALLKKFSAEQSAEAKKRFDTLQAHIRP
jgi:hypothetical protein